jgi:BT1 family
MAACTYIGVKGLLLSILGQVRLSYCKKTLGIDGTACQTLGAIAGTPWAVKGIGDIVFINGSHFFRKVILVTGAIGVISDMYPLFGWHKASYINLVGVLGVVAFFALAALPISTAGVAGFFLLMGNLQVIIV